LYDPNLRIGACGDWCLGGKIEAAFLSGRGMANRIAENHGSVAPANRLDQKE
jgi:predicted NAD/FAD-dependent oxidoreductase